MHGPRTFLFIGAAAVVLLGAAASRHAPPQPGHAPTRRNPGPAPLAAALVNVPARPDLPTPIPAVPAKAPSPPVAAPVPRVPAAADEDPAFFVLWLLELPEDDLRAFDASGALSRRLSWLAGEHASRKAMDEYHRFLGRLNDRLGVRPP